MDPETADATYIEPMTVASVERIIQAEKPDALLPTIGGQTALNLTIELCEAGVLRSPDGSQLSFRARDRFHTVQVDDFDKTIGSVT